MAIASGDGLFMVSVLCLSIVSPFHMDTKPAKQPLADLSSARKIVLLSLFCLAQFLETFNTSTLFSAIPVIATSTGLSNNQSVWLYSAYQLTFAALLLIVRHVRSCSLHPLILRGAERSDERHLQP